VRHSPPPTGLAVRLLGLRDLAAQPVKLGLLVVGRADRWLAGRMGEPFARAQRFVHCIRPSAVQLHDLGATHQALTTMGDQIRLRRAETRTSG
jgi:hypothetical protein